MLKKLFLLFLLVVLIIAFLLIQPSLTLTVKEKDGRTLVSQPVKPGDVVIIHYVHSVEKVPVNDTFIVMGDDRLLLRNTTFGSSGAGLPTDSSYNLSHTSNGDFLIENINRTFDRVNFTVGDITKNHLIVSDNDYPLYQMVPEGLPLTLSLERSSFVTYFHIL